MRILQLSPVDAYPPSRGGEHRTHGLVSAFSDSGDEIVRLAQGGLLANHDLRTGEISHRHEIDDRYVELRPRNPLYDLVRAPLLFNIPGLLFISEDRFFWRSRTVQDLFSWADVILIEGPWQVPAVLRADPDAAVVYSSHNVEADRDLVDDPQFLEDWTNRRIRKLESSAVRNSGAVVCTSRRDADRLDELYGCDAPTLIAPNATYAERLDTTCEGSDVRNRYGIDSDTLVGVFLGSDYGPNNEAAVQLAELTSRITASVPNFELLILGDCGDAVDDATPNVTVAGFVDNVEAHIATADIAFNPVTRGSGTNIKMFDYFVHGVPVITTHFGAQGIEVTQGEEVIVTELSSFPEWVERLVNDPELAKSIGASGRKLVAERYTWEHVSRKLRDELVTVLNVGDGIE